MTSYILIATLTAFASGSGVSVASFSQEFASQKACESAIIVFKNEVKQKATYVDEVVLVCVPKE